MTRKQEKNKNIAQKRSKRDFFLAIFSLNSAGRSLARNFPCNFADILQILVGNFPAAGSVSSFFGLIIFYECKNCRNSLSFSLSICGQPQSHSCSHFLFTFCSSCFDFFRFFVLASFFLRTCCSFFVVSSNFCCSNNCSTYCGWLGAGFLFHQSMQNSDILR